MTLRVLFQQLHALAGVTGVDVPIHIQGAGRRRFIQCIRKGAVGKSKKASVVLEIGASEVDRAAQRSYVVRRYHKLKAQSKCVRCAVHLSDGDTLECTPCREEQSFKRVQREMNKLANTERPPK